MSLLCLHITLSLPLVTGFYFIWSLPNYLALSSVLSSPYTSCFSLTGILQFSENSKLFSAPGPLDRSISLSKHSSVMTMPSFISKFEHWLVSLSIITWCWEGHYPTSGYLYSLLELFELFCYGNLLVYLLCSLNKERRNQVCLI